MNVVATFSRQIFLSVSIALIAIVGLFSNIAPATAAEITVKMGADNGMLAFVPNVVEIAAGDSVTWSNNKLSPHNVVFEKGPGDVSAFSHKALAFSPGETFSQTFSEAGEYTYYCEPHRGAGMVGKIVVK
jgi:plastocyanin